MSPPASSTAPATTSPPWADLLPDLCDLVTARLDAISLLRFPSVCTGWSAACATNPRLRLLLRPGSPALLTSGLDPDGAQIEHNVDAGAFALHALSSSSSFSFLGEAEGLKGRTWVGGKDGWVVTTDSGCDVELLHPVTGERRRLPPFATVDPGVAVPDYHLQFLTGGGGGGGRCHKMLKVALCRTPAHPDGLLAVALFSDGLLAFTTTGGGGGGRGECECPGWTAVKNPADASRADVAYMDAIVVGGKLFAVNERGRIYAWDIDDDGGGTTTEPKVVQGPVIGDKTSRRHDHGHGHENDNHDRCAFYLATGGGEEGRRLAGADPCRSDWVRPHPEQTVKYTVRPWRLVLVYVHGYDVADMHKYYRPGRCWDSRVWSRLVFDDRRSFLELGMEIHELDDVDDGGTATWRRVRDLGGGDRALFLGANYPFYVDTVARRGFEHDDEGDLLEADCVYLADTPYGCDAAVFDLKEGDGCVKRRLAYSLVADPLQMPMWFMPTDYPH